MKTSGRRMLATAFALNVLACGGSTPPAARPQPTTATVMVDNQSTVTMTVYALRGAQRTRLGTAHALRSTRFTIPPHVLMGVTFLRFLADAIGSSRPAVTSEFSITPGEEVVLTIPPRL